MVSETPKGTIIAYYPGNDYPSVSVTGTRCDQMCEHCKGKHLSGMIPVKDNDELSELAQSLVDKGCTGYLLSGGCDTNGSVPVAAFSKGIMETSSALKVNVHAGFVSVDEARELAEAGISCFSVDIHQDRGEMFSVLHLDRDPGDYSELLDTLIGTGVKVVPHVTVGFGYNDLALSADLIASKSLKEVVLLSMMPTEGTAVEESILTEDAVMDAVKILEERGLDVILGCMRDRSLRGLERRCIESGIRRLANPSAETLRWAEDNGYRIEKRRMCCCLD
ncbi:MAG: hypothetical protein J5673_03985 [Candidatus Methanomethylophilaceae archaeon]|nr:hypothetical protein [Candidatus Methanomethylophilaceae archaeon]